jgi:DNA repair exonuclease SbcCD ATPase subunit
VRDYDEVQHNDWTNSVNELNLKISKLEKLKTEINVKVEAFEQRITVYTRINMLKKQHGSEMNKVLNYIFGDYTISSDPVTLFENLNNVNAKMTKLEEYSQVNTQLIKLERDHHVYAENLKIFEKYGGESVDELEKKLILINNKTLTVIGKIKYINEKIKLFTNLKQIREDITNQMRDRRRALIYEKVNKINNQLDVSISKTTILLDDLQRRLSEVNYNRRNHNALMLKLESHENKYNVVSDIYDALSPNKGVIGELMTSVINSFITDMNLFIADVWSYKLEIQEMVPSEKGLDFKFKVNVKDSEIINDISQLSSSMQDIIDLAFVLTYSKYVGFEAMPVFLDEFGSTFDTEHLHTAYNVLDSLNDGDRQIFLITHHDTVFTRFGEKADIHVIDVKNLNIADSISYNNNFKLRR